MGNVQLEPRSETYPDRLFFLGGGDSIRSFLNDVDQPKAGQGIAVWLSFGRVLTVAIVVVAGLSLTLAHRAQTQSVRHLSRVALVLAVLATTLLLYGHIALTERATRLTGQTFGAFYGVF